jgi:hypothetical protein
MFCGTLRENVDPMLMYSDAAVRDALEEAGLRGKALDATVGVSGQGWSIGEKQLVCSFTCVFLLMSRARACRRLSLPSGVSCSRDSQETFRALSRRSYCVPR